jgi:hypothetical protein
MIHSHCETKRATVGELRQVIEPLASYICAAPHPRAALLSALEALRNEVAQTTRAANLHLSAKK